MFDVKYQVSQEKVLRLINNGTKAFCSISKISFVLDRLDPNSDFNISFLKVRQKLTELRELKTKMKLTMKSERSFTFRYYMHLSSCMHTSLMKKAY